MDWLVPKDQVTTPNLQQSLIHSLYYFYVTVVSNLCTHQETDIRCEQGSNGIRNQIFSFLNATAVRPFVDTSFKLNVQQIVCV
jgi:hypothetical protein